MAIILRTDTATNTGKGSKLTFQEMDGNLESYYISSSFTGNVLTLFTTGSVSHSVDLGAVAASVATGSFVTTASYSNQVITFTKADASTFTLNLGEVVVELESGSLLKTGSFANGVMTFEKGNGATFGLNLNSLSGSGLATASYSNQLVTFTKGDGTTFNIDLNEFVTQTESGSLLKSSSLAGGLMTFTKGDGTTYDLNLNSLSGSGLTTASYSNQLVTFTKGDGTTFNIDLNEFVTQTESGSLMRTGSYDSATNTLTFTKGDGSTFGLNLTSNSDAKIAVTDTSTNQNYYLTFVESTTGEQTLRVDSAAVVYNPSTNTLQTENLVLTGDLVVQGTKTELQVSELRVEDKLITVASGSINSAAADGAGIEIAGANQSITWDSSNSRFKTSTSLHVSGGLSIANTTADNALTTFLVLDGSGNVKTRSTGAQGAEGAQGAQGAQGSQGAQGAEGAQGAQGAQGAAGNNGAQGAQGAQGAAGNNGNNGAQGAQGAAGNNGAQGAQGAASNVAGPQGAQGAAGNNGNNGAQGAQGAQGAAGNNGNNGAQGAQGAAGNNGAQGAQGAAGNNGAQGAQGAASNVAGPQGAQGAAGNNGAQGAQGAASNVAGPQGAQGAASNVAGPQGAQGAAGNNSNVAGPQGAQGAQGAAGNNSNVAGPQGAQGAAGNNGNNGAQGAQGAAGNNGNNGSDGAQGATGAQGLDGTLGVNIYTADDSLISNRIVDHGGSSLRFQTTNSEDFFIGTDPTGETTTANVYIQMLPEPEEKPTKVVAYDNVTGQLVQRDLPAAGPQGATGAQGTTGAQGSPGAGGGINITNPLNNRVLSCIDNAGSSALAEADLTFTPSSGFGTQNWLDIDNGGLSFGGGLVYEGYFDVECLYLTPVNALSIPRDSYNAIFIDYTFYHQSSFTPMRTSNFVSHWNSSNITFTNHGTIDIGTIAAGGTDNKLEALISSNTVLIRMRNSITGGPAARLRGRYRLFSRYVAS